MRHSRQPEPTRQASTMQPRRLARTAPAPRRSRLATAGHRAVEGVRSCVMVDTGIGVTAFFALNVLLALVCHRIPALAAVHAGVVVVVGLGVTISRNDKFMAACVCAYIIGAEVLWRMVSAPIFWEFGKYAAILIMATSLLTSRRWDRRSRLMVLYIVCLLPSTLVFYEFGSTLAELKNRLSFNLSGPVAMVAAVMFFGRLNLTRSQMTRLFIYIIGPILGIAALAVSSTLAAGAIQFSNGSNFEASGGFGPNQVSAVLGLGVAISFLYLIVARSAMTVKVPVFLALAVCAIQGVLTFSRTGLYLAAATVGIASWYLIRLSEIRRTLSVVMVVGAVAAVFLVVPWLTQFTGGEIGTRWTDTSSTGRDDLFFDDIGIWRQNWALGVGPGNVDRSRQVLTGKMAHTEFSRLAAEHGMFGIASFLVLLAVANANLRRRRDPMSKGIAAALIAWSFLYMTVSAMRMVAPAFLFGLASAGMAFVDPRARHGMAAPSPMRAAARRVIAPAPAAAQLRSMPPPTTFPL
jgi:hypothetical protein